MSIEQNIDRLRAINNDSTIQNLIAQAHSRYILLNTSENKESFPPYTIQDNSLNILAFYYLEIGCSFAENQNLENAREPMEMGASILEQVHAASINKAELSNYYSVISALAYYVSFQYSKSFILIQKTDANTILARLISAFLQRNFRILAREVERIVVDNTYEDEFVASNNEIEGSDKIYIITIARSLNGFVKYFETGDGTFLETAKANLLLLKEISEIKCEPAIWWVIRLLILICDGFKEAALWNSLKIHFDPSSDIVKKYIRSLVYLRPRGIYELFITQRKSLSKVLNAAGSGCVVTIPTSSGKTRIAELAILDNFIKDPEGKVLYIAPFRSLAFEIENSLEKILSNVGITLSHLYGGSLFSRMDEKIIQESNVIIATPEKCKAILRGNREIADQIRLVVIDEGHLLGLDERLVGNEMFYDELRFFVEKNGGRFLLLSAVLPNSQELSLWLTKSIDTVYKDNWRPSDERLGVLEWSGEQVNLEWKNNDVGRPSFNNRFIIKEELQLVKGQKKVRYFPNDKNEAVAATAFKLKVFGTSLIFVGLKDSVFTMADAYLKCLGTSPEDFQYSNLIDWRAYQLACIESYGENSKWYSFAAKGILCHHGGLNPDVRLPLERLMRTDKPLVIISTSTLGQGVNLGVSTVIFSTLYQSGEPIKSRDFWNIAGRAGRAFVDYEGKVLVALDTSDESNSFKKINRIKKSHPRAYQRQKDWIIGKQKETIQDYFNKETIDIASSGILALIKALMRVSESDGVPFDLLIQLISENKIEEIGSRAKEINDALDLIDDTLLSLHDLNNIADEADYGWIENFFKNSLAYIQIKENDGLSRENLISFFKARVSGIQNKVGNNRDRWKSIINSGIPLNSDLFIESKMEEIALLLSSFGGSEKNLVAKVELALSLITVIRETPVLEFDKHSENEEFKIILGKWISGDSIASLKEFEDADEIVSDIFVYKLPWILSGIGKKFRKRSMEIEAQLVEEISMLIEVGLPNLRAVKIYQAGIRSRVSAKELSEFFAEELWEKSIKSYKDEIVENYDFFKELSSSTCGEWIDLLLSTSKSKIFSVNRISNFRFDDAIKYCDKLTAKEINGRPYLISPDLTFSMDVSVANVDFSPVLMLDGIYFSYDKEDNFWKMVVDNPYIEIN